MVNVSIWLIYLWLLVTIRFTAITCSSIHGSLLLTVPRRSCEGFLGAQGDVEVSVDVGGFMAYLCCEFSG